MPPWTEDGPLGRQVEGSTQRDDWRFLRSTGKKETREDFSHGQQGRVRWQHQAFTQPLTRQGRR